MGLLQLSVTIKYKLALIKKKADKLRGRFIFSETHSTYGRQHTAFKYKRQLKVIAKSYIEKF